MVDFLKRLFPKIQKDNFSVDVKTLPVKLGHRSGLKKEEISTKYRFASCQSPGKERLNNEDALFTFSSEFDDNEGSVFFGIFLVADGMGGHQNGEIASRLAAQSVSKFLIDKCFEDIVYEGQYDFGENFEGILKDAVSSAQNQIQRQVLGGGTTLTLAMVIGDQIFTAHVGDSRLYAIGEEGSLHLRTRDHTLVKRLVDLGEITENEASNHPQRNVLYQALGQSDSFEPDIDHFLMDIGSRLMICSDGLWSVVDEQQIASIIANGHTLEEVTCELVRAANDSGGPDNISVILVERFS